MISRLNSCRPIVFTATALALLWALGATLTPHRLHAGSYPTGQHPDSTSTTPHRVAQAAATPTPRATLAAPIGLISPTVPVTATATVTATGATTGTEATESRPIPGLEPTPTPVAETDADALSAAEEPVGPLSGTIIANHAGQTARFFVEGRTIELAASTSTGFDLPRGTTVLNLYNCAASTPESNSDCFWDPYILQRDGFYEIYMSRPPGVNTVARLMLRATDAPPADQVWIQNRTAAVESIVFRNEVVELLPAAVHEFAVDPGLPAILYVRNCIVIQGQSACEWAPKTLEAGIYYALSEVQVAGGLAGSSLVSIDLRPVVGELSAVAQAAGDQSAPVVSPGPAPSGDMVCRVLVPVLNVRSGPGLQYSIIDKIFSSEAEPGSVRVVGRDAASQWLVVDPALATDGWITGSENFVSCTGNIAALTVVAAPPLPVVEAPVAPQPAAPVATEPEAADEAVGEEPADDAVQDAAAPPGYAVLMVNNGFEHPVRFTLDQRYRPELGPSEIDLGPGESRSVTVFPGSLTFSVSSAWRGLSGNALIQVEPDTSLSLWLRFESDGSETEWRLNW